MGVLPSEFTAADILANLQAMAQLTSDMASYLADKQAKQLPKYEITYTETPWQFPKSERYTIEVTDATNTI